MILKEETIKNSYTWGNVAPTTSLLPDSHSALFFFTPIFPAFHVDNHFFWFLVYPFCISFADM